MRLLRWLVGVTVFGLPRLALASDLSGLETYATIESAGVRVTVNGDDDHDAVVYAEIRKKGAATFERGHRLLPVDFETTGAFVPGLHIGSSFFLESDTDYDVRVVLEDPDNAAPVELGLEAVRRGERDHQQPHGTHRRGGGARSPYATLPGGSAYR